MPLHVRDLGDGPPVVFLHPGPGLDGSVFLPRRHALVDAGYRALLVDLPGSGRSPGDDFTLRTQAAAVEELMRELGPSRPCSATRSAATSRCSTSSTSRAARRGWSRRAPTPTRTSPPDAPEDRFDGLSDDVAAGVREAFEREDSVTTPEECREVLARPDAVLRRRPRRASPMLDDVVFQVEAHHRARPRRAARARGAGRRRDPGARDRRRGGPPDAAGLRRAGSPTTAPRGELVVIEGVGHFPFVEAPERYWPALISWLERTGSGG